MDKIATTFRNAQLIMVGAVGGHRLNSEKATKDLYNKLAKEHKYSFAVAFDSIVSAKMSIRSVPDILVIDPGGIIKSRTYLLDSNILSNIMSGRDIDLSNIKTTNQADVNGNENDPKSSTDFKGNDLSDTNLIARSYFCKWNRSMGSGMIYGFDDVKYKGGEGMAEVYRVDLRDLLRISYTGKRNWSSDDSLYGRFSKEIIVEHSSQKLFGYSKRAKTSIDSEENSYCYSLKVPKELPNKFFAQNCLKQDLHRYFNFRSKIEKRQMPIWELKCIDRNKVKQFASKGGNPKYEYRQFSGFKVSNYSIDQIVKFKHLSVLPFINLYDHADLVPPLVDNTGIDFNIDLEFDVLMSDFEAVKRKLNFIGLDIVLSKQYMDVIVVSN
jgi:hypothetical protein